MPRVSGLAHMEEGKDHPRLFLPHFLPPDLCRELIFIHRSCGTVGYRPGVFSTTLSHLIATECSHLILPFVSTRERLKEKVEEFFGCEYELVIEFTGIVSWCKGASIGWHSDDNRPYLKQRDFTAVCYLNNHGEDFEGGVFHFKEGIPAHIVPMAGDVILYTADSRNIHAVDEVTNGERVTLTLWFSRDSSHDEDTKLISRLNEGFCEQNGSPNLYLPSPASSNMYWYFQHHPGVDIRCARIHVLGFSFYIPDGMDDASDPMEKPLLLCRGNEIYEEKFANAMHALQVVQFYSWKLPEFRSEMRNIDARKTPEYVFLQKPTDEGSKIAYDALLADLLFGYCHPANANAAFDWNEFVLAKKEWEDYSRRMQEVLLTSIMNWKTHKSIFSVESIQE